MQDKKDIMDNPQLDTPHRNPYKAAFAVLGVGMAAALAGDGYLLVKTNHLRDELNSTRNGAHSQVSQLGDATNAQLAQQNERFELLAQQVKGVDSNASAAIKRARLDAQRQNEEMARKVTEEHSKVTGELAQLNEFKDTAATRFTAVATDVDGVKANVETVKASVATTQSELEKNTTEIRADMKRALGDMGVMSGLIATNAKDLESLRALGERNYFEFDLTKSLGPKRVGDITLVLKKSDVKRNRFTVEVLADDKRVEKKDKTINEPVQLYVSGNMQPYEIVINQVKKDQVSGYLSTPKVKLARR